MKFLKSIIQMYGWFGAALAVSVIVIGFLSTVFWVYIGVALNNI